MKFTDYKSYKEKSPSLLHIVGTEFSLMCFDEISLKPDSFCMCMVFNSKRKGIYGLPAILYSPLMPIMIVKLIPKSGSTVISRVKGLLIKNQVPFEKKSSISVRRCECLMQGAWGAFLGLTL